MFYSRALATANRQALAHLVRMSAGVDAALVVGAPWWLADGRLFNCAFVIAGGKVRGAVPKTAHPNHGEYYDKRWRNNFV